MSTITGCPHFFVSFWPMVRAATSLGPPAANPTSRRMGLAGYCCADATPVVAMSHAMHDATRAVEVLMMSDNPFVLHALHVLGRDATKFAKQALGVLAEHRRTGDAG